jgi:signal transduction histidine kinase
VTPRGGVALTAKRATLAARTAMALDRLTWRVGLPFVLLVCAATAAIALFASREIARSESERFARVATTIAASLQQGGWQPSASLARDLQRVVGYGVFFRDRDGLAPPPPAGLAAVPLATVPADRTARRSGEWFCIAAPVDERTDLLLVREASGGLFEPSVLQPLAALGVLAIVIATLIGRGLVRPLRNLARQLPQIEREGPLDVPEARRADEIGDVARAFVRARQALHDERLARERAEKLAVLGRMTAALAHEVQNPVAAIRMHAQLWQRGAGDAATAATIEHEAARIESLLNGWMFLTRPEPPVPADVDVASLLVEVVAMHRAQAEHAAVRVRLDATPPLVAAADRRRLEQVFRNLLTNALQAMAGGGELAIDARADADAIVVVFADTGPGFSAAALQRFAELFFTEKEGGMGIGLSVASEIVKAHGGTLRVANGARGGAAVTVTLPVRAASAAPAAAAAESAR